MTLPMFRVPTFSSVPQVGETLVLDGPEGRHAVSVKRLRAGENCLIGDGHGTAATCTITHAEGKNQLVTTVTEVHTESRPTPQVTLIQALPKADRADLAVDLATQAGVDTIIPWQSERCIARWKTDAKRQRGHEKWATTARESAKQSRRLWDPTMGELLTSTPEVGEVMQDVIHQGGVCLILHEEAAQPLSSPDYASRIAQAQHILLIVGPEGGLTPDEVHTLRDYGGYPVLLGPTVLRTATAGAVALGALGVLTPRWSTPTASSPVE